MPDAATLPPPAPPRPADPLTRLIERAIEQAPDGPARRWLAALLERGESAEGRPPGR